MNKNTPDYEPGTPKVDAGLHIDITADGPYLVFGKVPVRQLFIMPNEEGNSWTYKAAKHPYETAEEPVALCRCGFSQNKPYCDGSHVKHATDWDPRLTAPHRPLLRDAETIEGPTMNLTDNEKYCAFARFCDAYGRTWNLTEMSDDPKAREVAIYEANHCPAGRLKAWDKESGKPYELETKPEVDLLEDPAIRCSAGIWVRGGIPVTDAGGYTFEVRNRVTLCRCGQSSNKPFCDGTHASMKFRDGLPHDKDGEEF